MRSRALALSVLGSATVLAGTVQLGAMAATATAAASSAPTASTSTSTSSAGTGSGSATPSTSSSSTASTPSSAPSSSSTAKSGTSAGAVEQTRFGPVQVEIVVTNGKITDVKALQLTNADSRSVDISNQAAPLLRQEALSAQSAEIDVISGATFTSEGYITSLQSALDEAGL